MLYLVATPIGNLKDITLRAIEVLEHADIIACEDTRHSIKLLNHYNIRKPLISYHEHNEHSRTEEIIKLLIEGKNIALITDAGTPCISDPGAVIVRRAREEGIAISAIPGASAVISAVSLAGIEGGFLFLGFLPDKNKDREALLLKYKSINIPLVLYLSPHSLNKDAGRIYNIMGDREVILIKEITKIYESVLSLKLTDFPIDEPKGEYVMIIMPGKDLDPNLSLSIRAHYEALRREGQDRMQAVKQVAKLRGINKNTVYQETLDNEDR